eukprot:3264088-Amphidinium_carterae.1
MKSSAVNRCQSNLYGHAPCGDDTITLLLSRMSRDGPAIGDEPRWAHYSRSSEQSYQWSRACPSGFPAD